jgi:hypothetical protein
MLEAIYNGDVEAVKSLIDFKRCILSRHPFTLASTVHMAVIHNFPNILKILLKHGGAPINSRDMVRNLKKN